MLSVNTLYAFLFFGIWKLMLVSEIVREQQLDFMTQRFVNNVYSKQNQSNIKNWYMVSADFAYR